MLVMLWIKSLMSDQKLVRESLLLGGCELGFASLEFFKLNSWN